LKDHNKETIIKRR